MEVKNIQTEPTNMEQIFFIYGKVQGDKAEKGVVIKVDFKSLH